MIFVSFPSGEGIIPRFFVASSFMYHVGHTQSSRLEAENNSTRQLVEIYWILGVRAFNTRFRFGFALLALTPPYS